MSRQDLEEAKRAWGRGYEGLDEADVDRRVAGFTALVRGIAEKGAVSAAEFGRATGLDASHASDIFSGLAMFGLERDDRGHVVGAALTTNATPHRVRFDEKELYAWCALDTLFIPGLVGRRAIIESTCPTSKDSIRLTVAPGGVEAVDPGATAISVVLPGAGGAPATTGPASPT